MAWSETAVILNGTNYSRTGSIGDGPQFSADARRVELWEESGGSLTESLLDSLLDEATLATGTAHPSESSLLIKRTQAVPLGENDSVAYAMVVITYQQLPPAFS
ncbi:MAG: hypothetical protein GVY12_00635 [Bacteroidetes bacterium]|jgi:hypothetical protein|nr:hypothetical protein [Bacteroidota bacterium]